MTDLFDKRSAKEKLWDWILSQRYVKTSDVIRWGTENFSNRALRNAQALAQEYPDKIKRMDDVDKVMRFGNIKEDVWVVL